MEKHKTFHIKDEQLLKDGFKKFMKNEQCSFVNCRFSRICNHIHCVRGRCSYVLHSTNQLYAHKRKHDRQRTERMYRKFKMAQAILIRLQEKSANGMAPTHANDEIEQLLNSVNMRLVESYLSRSVASTSSITATKTSGLISGNESSGGEELQESLAAEAHSNEDLNGSMNQQATTSDDDADDVDRQSEIDSIDDPKIAIEYLQSVLASLAQTATTALANGTFDGGPNVTSGAGRSAADKLWTKYCDYFEDNSCVEKLNEHCPLAYLNAGHYHCRLPNCQMSFRSKESVEDHYRNHERQNEISDEFYRTSAECSVDVCDVKRMDQQLPHYHCYWENCNEIVLDTKDKPFRRLEHFKIHERSKRLNATLTVGGLSGGGGGGGSRGTSGATSGDSLAIQQLATSIDNIFNRKRGRPPKNRPIETTQQQQQQLGCKSKTNCTLVDLNHFHCGVQLNCQFVTFDRDLAAKHENEFHKNFQFYDRNSDCTYPSCLENKINSHYHCLRPNCNRTLTKNDDLDRHRAEHEHDFSHEPINLSLQTSLELLQTSAVFSGSSATTVASTRENGFVGSQNYSHDSKVLYGPEFSCSRPFCKLKRKFHYHCNVCNQAFTEIDKLQPHIEKHHNDSSHFTATTLPLNMSLPLAREQLQKDQHLQPPQPNRRYRYSRTNNEETATTMQTPLKRLRDHPESGTHYDDKRLKLAVANFNAGNLSHPIASSTPTATMTPKDEPVPTGYSRFRFNEDCSFSGCGYREHQTHFHCNRPACGYSFCDKTRFVQHTARHERLDTLMGGEFVQFRANVPCNRDDCVFNCASTLPFNASSAATTATNTNNSGNKASHFHCLKCDFVCSDTNKVVAHRRLHQKMSSIQAAGFEKFTPTQPCRPTFQNANTDQCPYASKQTHYHCLSCNYTVLGLVQMTAHKYRHSK